MNNELSLSDFYPDSETKADAIQKIEQNRTPAEIQRQQKIDKLITLLFNDGLSFTNACEKLSIGRTTGYEYWKEWKHSEEPRKVDAKFWELLRQVETDNPEKALDAVTRLKIKLTDTNVNVNAKAEVTEHIEAVNINVDVTPDQLTETEVNAIVAARKIFLYKTRRETEPQRIH
jgi:hypothetical protein